MIELPGGAGLVAADAFGGKLALVDGRIGIAKIRAVPAGA